MMMMMMMMMVLTDHDDDDEKEGWCPRSCDWRRWRQTVAVVSSPHCSAVLSWGPAHSSAHLKIEGINTGPPRLHGRDSQSNLLDLLWAEKEYLQKCLCYISIWRLMRDIWIFSLQMSFKDIHSSMAQFHHHHIPNQNWKCQSSSDTDSGRPVISVVEMV